jgi:hypothetical protein
MNLLFFLFYVSVAVGVVVGVVVGVGVGNKQFNNVPNGFKNTISFASNPLYPSNVPYTT